MSTHQRNKVRSLFISDIHLGCVFCQADRLLHFLRTIETENLYLVGDIIDGWKMKNGIFWDDTYTFIVRRIAGMIKDGTKVVYVAGNHDEFMRKFIPNAFGHFHLVDQIVHETIDGRKFLVIHGDLFDQITMKASWLYHLGDSAYTFVMWVNKIYNYFRRTMGFTYQSLSASIKKNVKQTVNFINSFEHFLARYTKNEGCCGVICGHIHTPTIKIIEGIEYYNCGDWVESCSAIVEHFDGTLELIHSLEGVEYCKLCETNK